MKKNITDLLGKIHCGDCIDFLKKIPDNSIDAIITDAPYELGFMGKKWDNTGIAYNVELWRECLRILKAGGHLLAFGGTRTYHRMACAIEDAGFEIRDQMQWLYGSGFPKSLNISKAIDKKFGAEREIIGKLKYPAKAKLGTFNCSFDNEKAVETIAKTPQAKQWDGWGTGLKPAHEPICMARKPIEAKTIADNVLKYGTGGINIDACRIENNKKNKEYDIKRAGYKEGINHIIKANKNLKFNVPIAKNIDHSTLEHITKGRFPANVILSHHHDCKEIGVKEVKLNGSGKCSGNTDSTKSMFGIGSKELCYGNGKGKETVANYECHPDCPIGMLDKQSGKCENSYRESRRYGTGNPFKPEHDKSKPCIISGFKDTGTASRFFYCAKSSRAERNRGCENLEVKQTKGGGGMNNTEDDVCGKFGSIKAPANNHHPTVKPKKLMQYLIKLITPPNGIVLDPFAGSGSTLIACKSLGFDFIGIEKELEYCNISNERIKAEQPQLKLNL